jgi:uncharacterized lipoprotein YajG
LLQGCAINRETASVAADADITKLKTIFVVRSAEDERGVYITIAEQLRKLGYSVSTGPASSLPPNTDAVLSYQAKWQWDLTMYLLELKVTLRNPATDALLGTAASYHTSMTRKSTEEMVAEVLAGLRGRKPAAPAAGSGLGNAQVQLKGYAALPMEGARTLSSRVGVRIEPIRDARRDAVGSLIGERTTIGNMSMGMIEMQPPPAEALSSVLKAELTSAGFDITTDAGAASIGGRVTKFLVTTPPTALYWDINGVVELEVVALGRDGRKHEGRYLANCTDRTFVFPSADLITGVVMACLREIGVRLRKDSVLAGALEAR